MAEPKTQHQGFETQGDPYDQRKDLHALLKQVVADFSKVRPSAGLLAKLTGDKLVLTYISYEMNLDDHIRMSEAERVGREFLDDAVKHLKKEYKSRGKSTLTLKEDKEKRGESVEKVSLNLRFYYRAWRVFEVS